MSRYFVDAVHLIALLNPKDQWHTKAVELDATTADHTLVTTEDILAELLNFYSGHGEFMRNTASEFARQILLDVRVEIASRNNTTFLEALELYESRPDKGYSLTDCVSMNVCRELGIVEILSSDKHFAQEGFTILL